MASKYRHELRVHNKDSIEVAVEKNEKLINMVNKLEKEVRRLKSECRTLETAWNETQKKYKEAIKEVSLQEIFDHLQSGAPLMNANKVCDECKFSSIKKIGFKTFHILVCGSCGFRKKVNERSPG